MFARQLRITLANAQAERACPLQYLDSFAMRNFTGETRFDDTLPTGDGRLEAGRRVPLEPLRDALEDWFRRKSYLRAGERVVVREEAAGEPSAT